MANHITGLKLTTVTRGIRTDIGGIYLLKVNFNAVNLPGGGIAGVKKYKIKCAIARSKFSVSRNVTNFTTLAEKTQNISIGDVAVAEPFEFKFTVSNLFHGSALKRGVYFAVVTVSERKGLLEMKMSNFIDLD
ncbi:MAG TPA: hypothetical protein PK605_14740 [Ignavibacteria bacterium]|nr:hypothetical protein [Ignavibacteria bacterium]HRF67459.1 hypothetical protein [Ignavibacteria bacterium]HRJ05657.1 hypothetical protein [Ignavibacteria bacterium]HRJ86349.1 hypothetical protein [Ignavibacteria bacterium]